MISMLIWLLVLCLVFGVVVWIIQQLPLPPPFGNIAIAVLALIFVLILIGAFLGEMPFPRPILR